MTALAIRNLTKSFRDKRAVEGVDLVVPRGQIVGFLGPNGAGKTTVMNMITGLIEPDAGEIDLLGASNGARLKEVRSRIGYLQEKPRIYPEMTAEGYLTLFARLYGVARPAERVRQVLDRVGLRAAGHRLIGTFSRGMQQRACLARVLLHEPEFLLLDEPTLGLDPNGVSDMRQIFREMKADGVTLLFSSHQLAEMERVCDQVIFMNRGKVVAQGRQEDLFPLLGPSDPVTVELFQAVEGHMPAIRELPEIQSAEAVGEFVMTIVLTDAAPVDVRSRRALLTQRLNGMGLTVLSTSLGTRSLEDMFLALTARSTSREN